MSKKIETPEFKNEAEEALWWEGNQNLVLNELKQAEKDGTLGRGTLARRGLTSGPTTAINIRLDAKDVELARTQAGERGLRYQTYLKMVLHQALRAAERPGR